MIATNDIYARQLDREALRVIRGRGAVDLELGETLLALSEGNRLLRLGYAKLTDYGREALGLPARTLRQFTRLASGLRERPVLKGAVVTGVVSMRKALIVMDAATGEAEEGWTFAAARLSEKDLRCQIRAGMGAESGAEPEDVSGFESVILAMNPEQQDRLDSAIEAARVVLGLAIPKWMALDAIAMEWVAGHGEWVADDVAEGFTADAPAPATAAVRFEATAAERLPADPRRLDRRARRLADSRLRFDLSLGPVLRKLRQIRAWAELGFPTWESYLRERLGISPRLARQRIWLERRMDALPELREALSGRVLTYTKALFVAKDACPSDVAERIARAASTTLQQTERESDEDEERQNRADGVRRLWGPKEAFEVLSAVITGCREMVRARGEVVSAGEALARLADEFTETWGEEVKRIRKNMPKGRWEVMWRNGGLCAFPGCTRPAVHDHHVRFRSRGGSDDVSNRAPLCIPHHLRAIHRRWARLSGRAGVRLKWEFGVGLGGGEEFVTVGEDDVVRVG